jgi:serine O-acetyltransferase
MFSDDVESHARGNVKARGSHEMGLAFLSDAKGKRNGSLLGMISGVAAEIFRDVGELPQAIREKDPAARSQIEVLLLYPGVKAILAHRIAHGLWKNNLQFAARAVAEVSRSVTGVEIHPGAVVGHRVVIDHGMGVVVGETAVIEDDVTIYQGVTLGSTRNVRRKRHPTIRSGASIGVGSSVLGDIEVGASAQIGAGAVVLSDVPAGAHVGGIPASELKARSRSKVPNGVPSGVPNVAADSKAIFEDRSATSEVDRVHS